MSLSPTHPPTTTRSIQGSRGTLMKLLATMKTCRQCRSATL